jgi:hypothetical protein
MLRERVPSGLVWTKLSYAPPSFWMELTAPSLAQALRTQRVFTLEGWAALGIATLTEHDYVKAADGTLYRPEDKSPYVTTPDFADKVLERIKVYARAEEEGVTLPPEMDIDRIWTMGLLTVDERDQFATDPTHPQREDHTPIWRRSEFAKAREHMFCVQLNAVTWPFRIKDVLGTDELLEVEGPVEHALCYMSMAQLVADVSIRAWDYWYDCQGCFATGHAETTFTCQFRKDADTDTIEVLGQTVELPGWDEERTDTFSFGKITGSTWSQVVAKMAQAYYKSDGRTSKWYMAWRFDPHPTAQKDGQATITCSSGFPESKGKYNYVIIPNGTLLIGRSPHSVISCGVPVVCAGLLKWTGSAVSYIDNDSGHYRPPCKQLFKAIEILHKQNLLAPEGRDIGSSEHERLYITLNDGTQADPSFKLGMKWRAVDPLTHARIEGGAASFARLHSDALAAALAEGHCDFTEAQLNQFGVQAVPDEAFVQWVGEDGTPRYSVPVPVPFSCAWPRKPEPILSEAKDPHRLRSW